MSCHDHAQQPGSHRAGERGGAAAARNRVAGRHALDQLGRRQVVETLGSIGSDSPVHSGPLAATKSARLGGRADCRLGWGRGLGQAAGSRASRNQRRPSKAIAARPPSPGAQDQRQPRPAGGRIRGAFVAHRIEIHDMEMMAADAHLGRSIRSSVPADAGLGRGYLDECHVRVLPHDGSCSGTRTGVRFRSMISNGCSIRQAPSSSSLDGESGRSPKSNRRCGRLAEEPCARDRAVAEPTADGVDRLRQAVGAVRARRTGSAAARRVRLMAVRPMSRTPRPATSVRRSSASAAS